jgi:4-alpha-glucanotransferase
MGPTGFGDSPYQSFSSYAGNPYFIDLDILVDDGLLEKEEVLDLSWGAEPGRVDYGLLYQQRMGILKKCYNRYVESTEGLNPKAIFRSYNRATNQRGPMFSADEFRQFCNAKAFWLEDYSIYMAIKEHFNMKPWRDWPDDQIKLRKQDALDSYKELLGESVNFHCFIQYLFFKQWKALRNYAKENGVSLIGDIPIYVSMDSADAWASSYVLQFDQEGGPLGVAGVPPDYFSKTGQLWGNPLYQWDAMKSDNYSWWIRRIGGSAEMFDCLRFDHFRGLESYYFIEPDKSTAVNGKWMQGPAIDFINEIKKNYPKLEIIAEDLGILTPSVRSFVEKSGFPGMKVLQFAFGSGNFNDYLPHRYDNNSVVYTGTHDNTTLKGWLEEEASTVERDHVKKYFGLSAEEGWNWGIIRGAMMSIANLCVVQMQDYLDLTGIARINKPGTLGGNWQWRLLNDQLSQELAEKIKSITKLYGR